MRIFLITILIYLTACTNPETKEKNSDLTGEKKTSLATTSVDQAQDSTRFYPYKDRLHINSAGQLAFMVTDYSNPGKPHEDFLTTIVTDTIYFDQKEELSCIIDTATFAHLDDLYYRDKNHVYYHIQRLDGGSFFIVWEADPTSLEVLNSSYYAKDKNYVFYRGGVLEGADVKSFHVTDQPDKEVYSWRAKDKHHEYEGDNILDN